MCVQNPVALSELSDKISTALAEHEEVVCAYLFGSYLHSPEQAQDMDIGMYIDRKKTGGDILPATVRLFDSLAEALEQRNIDVVPLNDASHALRHEVISTGLCLYERDQEERVDFETKSERAYFDFLPRLKKFDEMTVQFFKESHHA